MLQVGQALLCTECCNYIGKTATDNIDMSGCVCIPIRLDLQQQQKPKNLWAEEGQDCSSLTEEHLLPQGQGMLQSIC